MSVAPNSPVIKRNVAGTPRGKRNDYGTPFFVFSLNVMWLGHERANANVAGT